MIEAGDDPVRQYTVEEEDRLTLQLRDAAAEVHAGTFNDRLTTTTLCELHRRLFGGIRGHAGRMRARGDGSEYLTFGPHRSSHRDAVAGEMDAAFRKLRVDLGRFAGHDPADVDYVREAIRLAARIHAEIIRTHPFEDGNGRSSRLMMNAVLVRLGLPPVAVDAVKQEYYKVLNHYFKHGDLDPLYKLLLPLFP